MSLPGSFPLPDSPDLGRLMQDHNKKVHQELPALCPRTLDDSRMVADKLSGISDVCQTVTKGLAAQDEIYDAAAAFKQVERAHDWAEFLAEVKVNPMISERTLLFRAHAQAATDQPGVYTSAARPIPFDGQYRQQNSVREFLQSLGKHLGKNGIEAETGERLKTEFTSTSPKLNWTLHLTGQKSRKSKDQVDFVIFDLQALCQTPETTVFHVKDVLRFLENSGQTGLIPEDRQQWTRNCDEYIIMGKRLEKGIVQVVPWPELRRMPIIIGSFCSAYTLSLYKQFRDDCIDGRPETEYGEACEMVVRSAKTIAGQNAGDIGFVTDIVRLILQPRLWFWGMKVSRDEADIRVGCEEMLGDGLVAMMSQVSL